MIEILVGANAVYLAHEQTEGKLRAFMWKLVTLDVYGPLLLVPLAGAAFAAAAGWWSGNTARARRYGLCLLMVAATIAGVIAQMKVYIYHFGGLAVALGTLGATAYGDCARAARRWPALVAAAFGAAAWGLFLATPSSEGWRNTSIATLAYAQRWSSRDDYARAFDMPQQSYAYSEGERVGLWLRHNARSVDTLAVRHFEPQIYAISGLHHSGRFFWTIFLTDDRRAYARDRWRMEDARVFREIPPRFVVALNKPYDPIDGCQWFVDRGYELAERFPKFCILRLF
jgi:hypothetical protein